MRCRQRTTYRGRDGAHGERTKPGKDVQLQMAHHLLCIAIRPFAIFLRLGMPGACGQLKGVEARNTLALLSHATGLPRVYALGTSFGLAAGLLAGPSKRNHRVVAQAQLGFFAELLVAVHPHLAGRSHAKVKTLAVRQQIFPVTRRCRLDLKLVELPHGVPKNDCG